MILLAACILAENAGLIPRGAANAERALQGLENDPPIGIPFTDVDLAGSMGGTAFALSSRQDVGRWLNRKFPGPLVLRKAVS